MAISATAASTLQTLLYRNPTKLSHRFQQHHQVQTLRLPYPSKPYPSLVLKHLLQKPYVLTPHAALTLNPFLEPTSTLFPIKGTLSNSLDMSMLIVSKVTDFSLKETLAKTLAITLAVSRHLASKLPAFTLEECLVILAKRAAALSMYEFKEPLVQVAYQAGKWVELYQSVLHVRILLSWFPNLPWERQPFSAMRDLCDPFMGLCRLVVPPMGPSDAQIDMSPLVGMILLGVVSALLKGGAPVGLPL